MDTYCCIHHLISTQSFGQSINQYANVLVNALLSLLNPSLSSKHQVCRLSVMLDTHKHGCSTQDLPSMARPSHTTVLPGTQYTSVWQSHRYRLREA